MLHFCSTFDRSLTFFHRKTCKRQRLISHRYHEWLPQHFKTTELTREVTRFVGLHGAMGLGCSWCNILGGSYGEVTNVNLTECCVSFGGISFFEVPNYSTMNNKREKMTSQKHKPALDSITQSAPRNISNFLIITNIKKPVRLDTKIRTFFFCLCSIVVQFWLTGNGIIHSFSHQAISEKEGNVFLRKAVWKLTGCLSAFNYWSTINIKSVSPHFRLPQNQSLQEFFLNFRFLLCYFQMQFESNSSLHERARLYARIPPCIDLSAVTNCASETEKRWKSNNQNGSHFNKPLHVKTSNIENAVVVKRGTDELPIGMFAFLFVHRKQSISNISLSFKTLETGHDRK